MFGLCGSFEEAKRMLIESPEVQALWHMTETRKLYFKHPDNPEPVVLRKEIVDDCRAVLYELSVSQALAGPIHFDARYSRVTDLVSYIYRKHVNNLNRRGFGSRDPFRTNSPGED